MLIAVVIFKVAVFKQQLLTKSRFFVPGMLQQAI